jgi:polyisoprenoid-binding protein YceI
MTIAEHATTTRRWTVDPVGSTVEFEVRNMWGLGTVRGSFGRFHGSYVADSEAPAIELTIDATSIDTGNAKRDEHLRAADFFDAGAHPDVTFTSSRILEAGDGRLRVSGILEAAGTRVPVSLDASVGELGDGLEIDAETMFDQRSFGMSSGPLAMIRPPARLHVRARLVPERKHF